jgi:glycosyltransferase involved in cell wall biosynthesis
MRILLITGSLPPMKCGVGDYTSQLAKSLGRRGDATVAVLTDVAASAPPDPDYVLFPVAHGWRISDLFAIAGTVRGWRPDVVHIQFPTKGYAGRILPFFLPGIVTSLRIPVVQTWHEYQSTGSVTILTNAMMTGGIIVVRPDYRSKVSPWYGWLLDRKPFRFIPNASTIPAVALSDRKRAEIRSRYASNGRKLITHFGFVSHAKGTEFLFDIADPARHHLVLICELNEADPYQSSILDRIRNGEWSDHVTITGFLPADEVGELLAASDAAVFPFRKGGGIWNTSVHGAVAQGTFVLTTSFDRHGYDDAENVYYAPPGDVADMRKALNTYLGRRNASVPGDAGWDRISEDHIRFYLQVIGKTNTTISKRNDA